MQEELIEVRTQRKPLATKHSVPYNSYTRRANRTTQRKPLSIKTSYYITVILVEVIEVRTQRKPLATNTVYHVTVILEELIELPRGNH